MRRDFDFALLMGVLLGIALACLLIFLPFVRNTDFVHRWQELIASLVALVAAAIALWAVRQQFSTRKKWGTSDVRGACMRRAQ